MFFDFLAGLLLRSQQQVLDAAEGREIEETSELDHKIALLKKRLGLSTAAGLPYDPGLVREIFNGSILPFAAAWEQRLQPFDAFFERRKVAAATRYKDASDRHPVKALSTFYTESLDQMLREGERIDFIRLSCRYNNLVSVNKLMAVPGGEVEFVFHDNRYEVLPVGEKKQACHKRYDEQLSGDEIDRVLDFLGNWVCGQIEKALQHASNDVD